MSKLAIISCSTSSIDYIVPNHNFPILRCKLIYNHNDIRDDFTGITTERFFEKLEEDDIIPSTTLPSPYEIKELFLNLSAQGFTDAIYLPLTKGASNTYSAACAIAEEVKDKINIVVFDTRHLGSPLGYMTKTAIEMANKNHTIEEISDRLCEIRDNTNIYLCVKDLRFLIKSGRLGQLKGKIGQVLKFKPIFKFSNVTGKIGEFKKIRTFHKALSTMITQIRLDIKDRIVEKFYITGANDDGVNLVREEFKEFKDITYDTPLNPILGVQVGPGSVCIAYTLKPA